MKTKIVQPTPRPELTEDFFLKDQVEALNKRIEHLMLCLSLAQDRERELEAKLAAIIELAKE